MSSNTGRRPEPTVAELLSDPIIRAVMSADGVDEAQLRELLDRVSREQSTCAPPHAHEAVKIVGSAIEQACAAIPRGAGALSR